MKLSSCTSKPMPWIAKRPTLKWRRGRVPLEQIQLSLGHASIQTIERYLGVRQDLHDAPCDRLGLDVRGP